MKNNYCFVAFFVAVLTVLTGCKSPIERVSVDELAKDNTPANFEKTETRSKTVVDGLNMMVTEYTITDKESDIITLRQFTYGDAVQEISEPVSYHYVMGSLVEGGQGVNYLFAALEPGEEDKDVLFWGNALIVDEDTIKDAAQPSTNLTKVYGEFPNHRWEFEETEYEVKHDTTTRIDTIITPVKRPDPITGKPVVVMDTTYKTVTVITHDTLGISYYHKSVLNFNRDAQYANTGYWYEYEEFYEEIGGTMEFKEMIEIIRDFSWGITTLTSASRFAVTLDIVGEEDPLEVKLSNFSLSKGTLTRGGVVNYVLADK